MDCELCGQRMQRIRQTPKGDIQKPCLYYYLCNSCRAATIQENYRDWAVRMGKNAKPYS